MKTQHKSERKALRRWKQDYSCARAFYFEYNRDIENVFGEMQFMSTVVIISMAHA